MPVLALLSAAALLAQPTPGERVLKDIPYRSAAGVPKEQADRLKLDLCVPTGKKGFATVVWFHGGGLSGGNRSIPQELRGRSIGVVAAGYRLHPSVKSPVYIEDAAAAVAWTLKNIAQHGGDPAKVVVSGHSAGGYLALMIGLDKRWLKPHGLDPDVLAGLVPFSGQCITHFTIRKERGIRDTQPLVDRFAPLFHVRKDAPPVVLITGDRERELLGRYEENAYMARMMKLAGHTRTELFELDGFDHGEMAGPAFPLLLRFMGSLTPRSPAAGGSR